MSVQPADAPIHDRRVLVVYATHEGHSAEIAHRIGEVIRRSIALVDVTPAAVAPPPTDYAVVVVGGSIHLGHHDRRLVHYLQEFKAELQGKPSALFQVSMTSATPDERHTSQAQALVDELERDTGLEPSMVGLFAGAILYTRYGWVKRHVMQAIARREDRETDASRDYDYTDWDAVTEFAEHVAALAVTVPAPGALSS